MEWDNTNPVPWYFPSTLLLLPLPFPALGPLPCLHGRFDAHKKAINYSQTATECSNDRPVTLPQSNRASWQADKSFLFWILFVVFFLVFFVQFFFFLNENELSQASQKRKGHQISTSKWVVLQNILFFWKRRRDQVQNNKHAYLGRRHGSNPSLLEDAGLASACTTSPVLVCLLTCFTFMLPQHRGIPSSVPSKGQKHIEAEPFPFWPAQGAFGGGLSPWPSSVKWTHKPHLSPEERKNFTYLWFIIKYW